MKCKTCIKEQTYLVYLPIGQGLDFRPLLLIDSLIALDEGKVGLGCDVVGASVSGLKLDYIILQYIIRNIICSLF